MDDIALSHRLSDLLRHRPRALVMDAAGWVAIADLLRVLGVDRAALDRLVAGTNKRRFEVDGERVRACQGHSQYATPVTLEALEASWARFTDDAVIWYGTAVTTVEKIAASGAILPRDRTHVHLAAAFDRDAGKRLRVEVMLGVATARLRDAGVAVYRSGDGVLLVRQVPAACVVSLVAVNPRAEPQLAALRDRFPALT